jgi:hypothetical protein
MTEYKQYTLDGEMARLQRDIGMDLVERFMDDELKKAIALAIVEAARTHGTFTTDAVLPHIGVPVEELRALGPLMKTAQRYGLIDATPWFENSASISRHGAPKRIWRSNIYKLAS